MRAVVTDRPGPPEVLEVRTVPRPAVRPGWTLVQVKAFGLNRSELMTRQGHSPGVQFPRVLGIECVGVVADPSDSGLPAGTTVNVIGCQASWCRVAFGGTMGFASRGYLGLGGAPVAAGPAFGEGYASGGYAPRYGYYSESSYGYGPRYTYGYSGSAPVYGESYGYYGGERTFGTERRFGEQSAVRGESSTNVNVRARSEENVNIRGRSEENMRSHVRGRSTTNSGPCWRALHLL